MSVHFYLLPELPVLPTMMSLEYATVILRSPLQIETLGKFGVVGSWPLVAGGDGTQNRPTVVSHRSC